MSRGRLKVAPGVDRHKLFVRRNACGTSFKKVVDAGRSIPRDKRTRAKRKLRRVRETRATARKSINGYDRGSQPSSSRPFHSQKPVLSTFVPFPPKRASLLRIPLERLIIKLIVDHGCLVGIEVGHRAHGAGSGADDRRCHGHCREGEKQATEHSRKTSAQAPRMRPMVIGVRHSASSSAR